MGKQRGGRVGGTGRVTAGFARCNLRAVVRSALVSPEPEGVRLEVGRVRQNNWRVRAGLASHDRQPRNLSELDGRDPRIRIRD